MTRRVMISLCAVALLAASGAAVAQQQGETSGPAAGKHVDPTTTIQKRDEGRSSVDSEDTRPAAGMPGVEGMPGTESGRTPEEREAPED